MDKEKTKNFQEEPGKRFKESIKELTKYIGHFFINVGNFFYSIRYIFMLPLISFASAVFAFALDIIIQPIFNFVISLIDNTIDMSWLDTSIILYFIAAVVFIFLKCILFDEKLKKDPKFDEKKDILLFSLSVIWWIIPLYFIKDYYTLDDSVLGLIIKLFYMPHLYAGPLFENYFIGGIIGLVLNIGIIYFICNRNIIVFYDKK